MWSMLSARAILLIVPYGIETYDESTRRIYLDTLLIVPYGIETRILTSNQALLSSFNRTLWN